MASVSLIDQLECSICLNLYTDPVTLKCGHNFCRDCIDQVLNSQDEDQVYSCPECRAGFGERPTLQKNITLCNIVDNFHTSTPQDGASIFCSYCVDSLAPAVKSCLHCDASLCDKHLRVHSKAEEHVLSDPSISLQDRRCSLHKKILEYYCTEDATCICVSCCLVGEHQGHKMESLATASEKRKGKLRDILSNLTSKIEETEERVQSLRNRRRETGLKSAREVRNITDLFGDFRRWLLNLEVKALSQISQEEEQVLKTLSNVIQNLEMKKDELSRKMKRIEEMCNMADPLTVLQEVDTGDLGDLEEQRGDEDTFEPYVGVESISHVSQTLSDIIRDLNVTFYVQDPEDILLDLSTADNNIRISPDLRIAAWTRIDQNRPKVPSRFQNFQVVSSTSFDSGRHYWDIEVSESEEWKVGICYPSIDRRGSRSFLGDSEKSWCLHGDQYKDYYSVIHEGKVTQLPHQITSDRVRIYLDYEAGQLSFYEQCDPIIHLHTFTATFTEPLLAALYVWKGHIKMIREEEDPEQFMNISEISADVWEDWWNYCQ